MSGNYTLYMKEVMCKTETKLKTVALIARLKKSSNPKKKYLFVIEINLPEFNLGRLNA